MTECFIGDKHLACKEQYYRTDRLKPNDLLQMENHLM